MQILASDSRQFSVTKQCRYCETIKKHKLASFLSYCQVFMSVNYVGVTRHACIVKCSTNNHMLLNTTSKKIRYNRWCWWRMIAGIAWSETKLVDSWRRFYGMWIDTILKKKRLILKVHVILDKTGISIQCTHLTFKSKKFVVCICSSIVFALV